LKDAFAQSYLSELVGDGLNALAPATDGGRARARHTHHARTRTAYATFKRDEETGQIFSARLAASNTCSSAVDWARIRPLDPLWPPPPPPPSLLFPPPQALNEAPARQ
jgi:hypothetical protein